MSEKRYLVIMSAMNIELESLIAKTENPLKHRVAGLDCYTGRLMGLDVLLCVAGVGVIMASALTAALAERFSCRGLIFTGIAGGVGEDLEVLDVVVADAFVSHDYGRRTNGDERDDIPGFIWWSESGPDGLGATDGDGLVYTDPALSATVYKAAAAAAAEGGHKALRGVVASGNQFIASAAYVAWLRQKFKALACEMEGAAVASVASLYGIPCAVLRCISDVADGRVSSLYEDFIYDACRESERITLRALELIKEGEDEK